jgi:hypothetical protein
MRCGAWALACEGRSAFKLAALAAPVMSGSFGWQYAALLAQKEGNCARELRDGVGVWRIA